MKYEERVTHRTTASGGQETITEMVPVYNRLEKRAMRRRAAKESSDNSGKKGIFRSLGFIIKHPTFCLIVVGLIAIFTVYMISSANSMLDELIEQYTSLTARKDDSKYSFDKRLFYITVNEDGTKTVTFGYKSEIAQEAAEEAAEQAGETGGNTSWNGTGFAASAMDFYTPVKFGSKGTSTGVTINDVQLYTGIPWKDDGNWYQFNVSSASKYLSTNLGKGLSTDSSVHSDNNNSSSKITKDGVGCMGIAWTPIFCFIDVAEDGSMPGYSASTCNEYYGAAILEKGGSTYYLPICSGGDNKGHTFPGGLTQTYIGNGTRFDTSTGTLSFNSGGNNSDISGIKWGANQLHGMSMSKDEFVGGWSTQVKYNGAIVGNCGHPMLTLETNSVYKSALSGYSVTGFVIHKK